MYTEMRINMINNYNIINNSENTDNCDVIDNSADIDNCGVINNSVNADNCSVMDNTTIIITGASVELAGLLPSPLLHLPLIL